jgi:hypothetical protein
MFYCWFFVKRLKDDGEGSAYDQETLSTIKMNNTTVLYLREVNKYVQISVIMFSYMGVGKMVEMAFNVT